MRRIWLAVILMMVMGNVVFPARGAEDRGAAVKKVAGLEVGKPFPGPEFVATDGTKVNVGEMKGKVVVIYSWKASKTGATTRDRRLADLWYGMHDRGFELIGVCLDSDREKMNDYLSRNKFKWPQYFDAKGPDNKVATQPGITESGIVILIDKDGLVADSAMWTEELDARIREMVTGHKIGPRPAVDADKMVEAEVRAVREERQKASDAMKGQVTTWLSSAEKGDVKAQERLGWAYLRGMGAAQDFEKARTWYRKAAENGDAKAQTELGLMYHTGEGVIVDYNEAFRWYAKAAAQGYPKGQWLLSSYASGHGVIKDPNKVIELRTKAAGSGDVTAQYALGDMYTWGRNGVSIDKDKGAQWHRRAYESYTKQAEAGSVRALAMMGEMILHGSGVQKDVTKGIEVLTKAAEKGSPHAQYLLGMCYSEGRDGPKDHVAAAKWFARAAGQDVERAQYQLALMYRFGDGVSKNTQKAVEWYSKAAAQGDPIAQEWLADMYYEGTEVKKDYVAAYAWLDISNSRLPSEQMKKDMEELAGKMTAEQMAEARKRAKAFVPMRQPGEEE